MNDEHFGSCLRRAREERALTLGDIAVSTKVPRSALELLESGTLSGLPAHVFVRGFIRSYAKAVGIADEGPLGLFDRAVGIKRDTVDTLDVKLTAAEKASVSTSEEKLAPLPNAVADDEEGNRRRGLSFAVFVIILVLIATITLSLLLRRPPQSGEGLSFSPSEPCEGSDPPAMSSDRPSRSTLDAIA
jgi:cytoskeletal protein RodZ